MASEEPEEVIRERRAEGDVVRLRAAGPRRAMALMEREAADVAFDRRDVLLSRSASRALSLPSPFAPAATLRA